MKNKYKAKKLAIIPAYNESENIAGVVLKIQDLGENIDIVVIDDGSIDETAYSARHAGASVIRLCTNMGYGVALQTGFKYAYEKEYDYIIHLDGDGQHNPKYIPEMFDVIVSGEADLVLGSRFLKRITKNGDIRLNYKIGKIRRVGIALFSFLASQIIGIKVTDTTSGYQAFNRRVNAFLIQDFFPCDYPDADVLLMLSRSGFIIREFPMTMSERNNGLSMHSGIKPVYYVFKMLLSMIMTLFRKYPKH